MIIPFRQVKQARAVASLQDKLTQVAMEIWSTVPIRYLECAVHYGRQCIEQGMPLFEALDEVENSINMLRGRDDVARFLMTAAYNIDRLKRYNLKRNLITGERI